MGDSDYEFWCSIPPEALGKLAFALMKKHYAGRERAVDEFRTLCAAEKIPHENQLRLRRRVQIRRKARILSPQFQTLAGKN